jgi:hypothetical protein
MSQPVSRFLLRSDVAVVADVSNLVGSEQEVTRADTTLIEAVLQYLRYSNYVI